MREHLENNLRGHPRVGSNPRPRVSCLESRLAQAHSEVQEGHILFKSMKLLVSLGIPVGERDWVARSSDLKTTPWAHNKVLEQPLPHQSLTN